MPGRQLAITAVFALIAASAWAEGEVFRVVVLPDTQNYSKSFPEIYAAQTQWIADQTAALNIRFVSHVGDIVNNGPNLNQWANARAAMDILDAADMPYGTCMGNHDNQYGDAEFQYPPDFGNIDPNGADYLAHFGPQFYAGETWYGGASPSGLSNYQIIEAAGRSWLFLHLEVDTRPAELAWAEGVLAANRDKLVVLSTHRYLYDYRLLAGRFGPLIYSLFDGLYYENSTGAHDLFDNFIAKHANIFLVLCGHVDAEYHQISRNDAGRPVFELLQDFQSYSSNGGDGWLRVLTFDTAAGKLKVESYSPTLGRTRTQADSIASTIDALVDGIDDFGPAIGLSPEQIAALTDLIESPLGKIVVKVLLYTGKQRDPNFSLKVDFDAYTR